MHEFMTLNAAALLERMKADDVVLLHDPQTAGLAAHRALAASQSSGARMSASISRTRWSATRGSSSLLT